MTLDLMLMHVETGTCFGNTYGDSDKSFYENLELTLNNFANLFLAHPRLHAEEALTQRMATLERGVFGIG